MDEQLWKAKQQVLALRASVVLVVLVAAGFFIGVVRAVVLEEQQIIDVNNDSALLVRKDGSAGDVFIVNTSSSLVSMYASTTVYGVSDSVQLTVRANGTQTSNIVEVQDNTGSAVARFDKSANLQLGNGNFSLGHLKIGGSVGTNESYTAIKIDRNYNSTSAVYAINGELLNSGTGDTYGLSYVARAHNSAGTITNLVGVYSDWRNTGGGAVTNAYGYKTGVSEVSGGGSVSNTYGLYVDSQTLGTNDYGIYVEGADTYALWSDAGENRLDGTVRMGKATTSSGWVTLPSQEVRTNSEVTTTLLTLPLATNTVYHAEVRVVGVGTFESLIHRFGSYHLEISTRGPGLSYNSTGSINNNATTTVHASRPAGVPDATWRVFFATTTNQLSVNVVGDFITTSPIQWAGTLQYLSTSL